jgi:hypothetical protein
VVLEVKMASPPKKPSPTLDQRFISPVIEFFADGGALGEQSFSRQAWDAAGTIGGHIRVYTGKNAFRVYNGLTDTIGLNSIGTLQGKVKSAQWRAVFNFATETGEKIEFIAMLASFASNIAEVRGDFDDICNAKQSEAWKAAQFLQLTRKVAARTAMGTFTGGVHGLYQALMGWCMIGGALTSGLQNAESNQCVQILRSADWLVTTTGKRLADIAAQNDPTLKVIEIMLRKRD